MALHLQSGGISFSDFSDSSATGASTGSELLDDYEEGTWTPIMMGSSTNGSGSSQAGTGRYTKVGNLCHIQLEMSNKTISGESGALKFTQLPFTANATNGVEATAAAMMHDFTWTANYLPALYVVVNNTELYGIEAGRGADWTTWAVTNTSTLYFRIGITYHTVT